ncbi:MAG: 30S ribosomal protein S24e [Candidatus Altiarchaeales archaeon]|nr:30S ribosomal protein S24e [Candidatus Altiarchaeales archaeon]
MDIEVVEDKRNELLKRREIRFKAYYEAETPSRQKIREKIITQLKLDPSLTVLDNLQPEYGKPEASGYLKSYDDAESMEIESRHKIERNKKTEPEKAEKKPPESAPESGDEEKQPKEDDSSAEKQGEQDEKGEKPKEDG